VINIKNSFFTLLLLLPVVFISCKKPAEYPNEPVIAFKNMYTERDAAGYDRKLYVTLDFTDGDGDIGYNEVGFNDAIFDDPHSKYYNNFQVRTFHYENGVLINDTVDLSARMLNVTPEVKNKALKGEILRELPLKPNMDNDTFHFEIFIYDRGLHASNIITTPDIVLKTH
jgi:hypothetical protein